MGVPGDKLCHFELFDLLPGLDVNRRCNNQQLDHDKSHLHEDGYEEDGGEIIEIYGQVQLDRKLDEGGQDPEDH